MAPVEAKALPDPPTDGITALSYLPDQLSSDFLLASTSWDGCLRIHDTASRTQVVSHSMESGPLLSLATPGGGHACVYTGGLDGSIRRFDLKSSVHTLVGQHSGGTDIANNNNNNGNVENIDVRNGCSCLAPVDALSGDDYTLVASAGWDSMFHVWDSRISQSNSNGSCSAACSLSLPGKAFAMDCAGPRCVIATAGRRTCIVDLRMASSSTVEEDDDGADAIEAMLSQNRESSLKYQTRTVQFFPDGSGLALGSIEGRVAIEYLEGGSNNTNNEYSSSSSNKKKKYAFKCHRMGDTVYPVNSIAFHPTYGTFATGGCDGSVVIWDAQNKKRLTALGKFATSIAAMAFNHDGTELAIASSYTFEEGERDHPKDEIYIRPILDHESKPKAQK